MEEYIKELGFILNNSIVDDDPCAIYKSDELNLAIGFYQKDNSVSIITRDPSKNKEYCRTMRDPNRVERVIINSKSELLNLIKL